MLYRGKNRGKFSRPRVAERRLRRPVTSATGTHSSTRYCGARPCKHLNTSRHSLNVMRCGTSSQCRSSCRSRVRPRSNFRVPLMTRATAFMTRCSLSVQVFGAFANNELPCKCCVTLYNNNNNNNIHICIAPYGRNFRGAKIDNIERSCNSATLILY